MDEPTDACEARAAECTEAAERAALRDHKPIETMYLALARQWQILAQQAAELERERLRGPEPDSSGLNDFRIKIFLKGGVGRPVARFLKPREPSAGKRRPKPPPSPPLKKPGITWGEVCVDGMGKPNSLPRGDVSTLTP
jgi:hypothetical protein